jgi:hypothetical protein
MAFGQGFRVVEGPQTSKWYPVGAANTVYQGQIVKFSAVGVAPLGAAVDGPEAAANGVPFGIVTAVNNRVPTSNSTYSAEYGTQVATQATLLARDYFGVEGMWGKGDGKLFAHVQLLDPTSVIEGPIANSAYGTSPSVVTCTTADSNGLSGMVHGAGDAANYSANNAMYYCRSGNNKGVYMQASSIATATTPTFTQPWPKIWAVNDTFVLINVALGKQKMQLDAQSMYIENSSNMNTGNYYPVDVLSMNLAVQGQCTAQFRFAYYLLA